MMTFLMSLFSLIAAAVAFAGYKTIFKIEENDEDHVLVLSDGLGSGVKANILSTLTATMLSTMIINQVELDEAVRAVAKTLPVCSV